MKRFSEFFTSLSHTDSMYGAVVGIDIGSSSIKVVQLEQKRSVLTLTTYGELQLGPYADKELGESVSLQTDAEQAALVDVIRESAVTAKQAVFAMPLSSSFVTNVSLQAAADADLASMVRVEARKVIPASLSEVTLDWVETGTGEPTGDSKLLSHHVLIAAIQNNALERFNVLLKFAGMNKPPTEIECFSAIRGLIRKNKESVAIVDLGADSAKLYIVKAGQLVRMHRVRAGGVIATQAIASEMSLSFPEAEELKLTIPRTDARFAKVQAIHNESYQRALREFRQVIAEYTKRTNEEIELIRLTGGAANFPGTDSLVQDQLQCEVEIADPFDKVAYPAFMEDTMREIGPSFTVALGAALRQYE